MGGQFQVNTTSGRDQESPSVAMTPGGNFVIVWEGDKQDGSGWGIFGQQFNNQGVPGGQ